MIDTAKKLIFVLLVTVITVTTTSMSAFESNSDDFQLNCQSIGDPVVGESSSDDYSIVHTSDCITIQSGDLELAFEYIPQGRFGAAGTNDQTEVTIEVRPVGGGPDSFIFSETVTTGADGTYSGLELTGVLPGNYDITAKGWANLRKVISNVTLVDGVNSLDFTNARNDPALGGDVDLTDRSGAGSGEQGDNEVSAADYSVMVDSYNLIGPAYDRYDLVQFGGGPSAADYSILVDNYGQVGE